MKLIIDDAHIDRIRQMYEYYPVDGVTTNPSILAQAGRSPYEVLHEIRDFIGSEAQLHVQVVARDYEGILQDAYKITKELGRETFVKIPAVPEGFKAMKFLGNQGFFITATSIYTPMQAFLAAKAGVAYCAPYINRIDNMGYNGVAVAKRIHDMLENNHMETQVLAASFKNSQQLLELCEYGIGASTVAPDVIEGLVKDHQITFAIDEFVEDFEGLVGEGRTMKDC